MQNERKRQRSVRVLLAVIFVLPLASLLGLWGFAASVTLSNALQEHNFSAENKLYGGQAQALGTALALERMQVFDWLSGRQQSAEGSMPAQFRATNAAVAAFRSGVRSGPGMIQPASQPALDRFDSALDSLANLRSTVESGRLSALAAFQAYNAIVDDEFGLYHQLIQVNNTSLYQQAAASVEAGRSLDMADRQITLVSGAIAAGGSMSKPERLLFAEEVASQRLLMSDALRGLDPSLAAGYVRANASAAYRTFTQIQDRIINSTGARGPIPVSPLEFAAATVPLFHTYYLAAEATDRTALTQLGTRVGDHVLLQLGLAGGLGLVAIAASVVLMTWFARRINGELGGLQRAALELADVRLPAVMARLSKGEDVDVAEEAAPLAEGRIAETARVAEAFSSVQRTAVEAAVGQARLRAGVAQVFRNLAWRSQSLLHRQLALLDAMERRSTEPEALDELFQLDHLTTRMRRHAEGLIILSGATPGRGWREPVPVIDVLRGAIAEVEDYKRVAVVCESQDRVVGSAVADVIHLLAELIENGASYSPASSEVTVRADRVANGFVIEIEDRGIGIRPEDLPAFNQRLADPPEFDIEHSNQLGLFVVARLAARHRIVITLRASPYGGTTAIVLLPHPIIVLGEPAEVSAGEERKAMVGAEASAAPRQLAAGGAPGPGAPPFDVFRPRRGAVGQPAGQDVLASQIPAAAASPELPRRVRQASLAPQLKADHAEASSPREADQSRDTEQPGDNGEPGPQSGDNPSDEPAAGPSPAGTRALVESLQAGLERARLAAASGPIPGGGPQGAAHREFWPSPTGSPGAGPAPQDAEGSLWSRAETQPR